VYDRPLTDAAIERAVRGVNATRQQAGLPGDFRVERHTVSQIERNNAHFAELVDLESGQLRRELAPDEIEWIRNERLISALDYSYWAERYAVILDFTDRLTRYTPNVAQRMLTDIDAELEREGRAIERANLKARRLGVSLDAELKLAHRVLFQPNVNALIASSRPQKSEKMSIMMERAWRAQPWFLMPSATRPSKDWPWGRYVVGELIEFEAMDSGVSIQHGAQFSGVARGDTPTVYHCSEVAEWLNAKEAIDASLIRAVIPTRWVFGVIEGTGAGKSGWWYETWLHSKAHWQDGTARLMPVFLPWYVGTDIYPTRDERRHIPPDWQPQPETIQHANKAKDFVSQYDLLRKHLGSNWEMPREQMWWWEKTRAEYKAKRELGVFYSEVAADDLEAFNNPNPSVFDAELIMIYKSSVQRPAGVYALDGPSGFIDPKFKPAKHQIDRNREPVRLGDDVVLRPLRFSVAVNEEPAGRIFVWHPPEDGYEFGLGVDCSMGIGLDNTAIEALRKGTMHANDAQAAEFVSSHLNALQSLPWCHALARWYSVKINGELRQPLWCIETAAGGYLLQLELRKLRWTRFHKWLRAYDAKTLDKAKANLLGWATTGWSRDGLISKLMEYIANGWIELNSPWFVDEMEDLEADEERRKIAAAQGKRDDRIMGLAMILFSLHDLETRASAGTPARRPVHSGDEEEPAPVWRPGLQQVSVPIDSPERAVWVPEDYEPAEELWPN